MDDVVIDLRARRLQLFWLSFGVVGALSVWFSATAILPALMADRALSGAQLVWMNNAVQFGFVVGAILSSVSNLPDIVSVRKLMVVCAFLAALANVLIIWVEAAWGMIALRAVCGVMLAGIYPSAMKVMSSWYVKGRGLAMGILIGALTLGSSLAYLLRALSDGQDWRLVMMASSVLTLVAALVFLVFVREGPFAFGKAVFDPRQVFGILRQRSVMLANGGYFGHMWELYAMWGWFLAFAQAAEGEMGAGFPFSSAAMMSFVVVASGVVGCVLGGVLAERYGRCWTTMGMMLVSGLCALGVGFVFEGPAVLLVVVAVIWGVSVIGDSAQFSASVTELTERNLVGTALTLQMGVGFALSMVSIALVPLMAQWLGGWRWTFLILAPGPLIGFGCMFALRRMPEAAKMAGGKR